MKEAPGALRDLSAARTIAMLTDPAAAAAGASRSGASRSTPRISCCACVRSLHLEAGRNQNVLSHELQERTAELLGYPGAEPRQRVERLMSDYFRHARTVDRSLGWARKARAGAGRAEPRRSRATASASSIRCRRRATPRPGSARSRRRSMPARAVSEEALVVHPAARRSLPRGRLLPGRQRSRRAAASPQAAAGTLRAALGDARLRSARAGVPRVPGDLVAGRARLLPQVHGRRAHAADDPQSRAAAPTRRVPSASASRDCSASSIARTAGAVAAAPRRRQVARRRPCGRKRAHGARSCSIGCDLDGEARETVAVPDSPPPEDVARRLPARHRGSGDRQAVRRRSSASRSG